MSARLLTLALLGTVVIFIYAYSDWQRAIKGLLLIVVFEGALRKWVLPQASDMIYFLKDIVLLAAYAGYYRLQVKHNKTPAAKDLLGLLTTVVVIWCLAEAFNPRLGSPIVGLLGLKAYLLYIPLIWLLPTLFSSQEKFYQFLRIYLLLIIPIGILGIVQYFSPYNSIINAYAPGEVTGAALVNDRVRITGTFSYLAGYAVYLTITFGLLLPLLSLRQSWFWRALLLVELFLVVVNSFMSGSRGVVFSQGLLLFLYLMLLGIRQPGATLRLISRFVMPAIGIGYLAITYFQAAIDNFMLRVTSNQDMGWRILDALVGPFWYMEYSGILGYGAGATLPGGNALRVAFGLPYGEWIPVYFESEMARVMLEIGPIGFILWYLLRAVIMLMLLGTFWRLRTPVLRQLALTAFLIHLLQFPGQLIVNHTFIVYYWFLASFIFVLPRLDAAYESPKQEAPVKAYAKTTYHPRPSYG